MIGIDRIREIYKQSFEEAEFDSIELQDLTINVHGDFAVATCHLVAETKFKSDGSLWELNCRTSFAFVKNGEKWQILMEHSSELPDVPRLKKREN